MNFARAAKEAGVSRIIYLGGLGNEDDPALTEARLALTGRKD